jgi:hypothetical protein
MEQLVVLPLTPEWRAGSKLDCVECLTLFSNRSLFYGYTAHLYLELITPNRPFA